MLQIKIIKSPDRTRFVLIDLQRPAIRLVAKGDIPTHPQPFALGGRNLVPDTLGRHLPLELGKAEQHIQRHRPMLVAVLNDWVTETKDASA